MLGKINDNINNSYQKIDEFKNKFNYKIIKNNSFNNIIKDNTDYLKINNITENDLNKIKLNIEKLIKNNELDAIYSELRLKYLVENRNSIEKSINKEISKNKSPFCENIINISYKTCPKSGFNLNREIKNINTNTENKDKMYKDLVEEIEKNNWNYDEVFKMQCLAGVCSHI